MVCFITFGFYTSISPFQDDTPNIFAQLCQVQIFFALLSSIALKFSTTMTPSTLNNMDVLLTILTFIPITISAILHTPLSRLLERQTRSRLQKQVAKLRGLTTSAPIEPMSTPTEPGPPAPMHLDGGHLLPPPPTADEQRTAVVAAPLLDGFDGPGGFDDTAELAPGGAPEAPPAPAPAAATEKNLSDRLLHVMLGSSQNEDDSKYGLNA